jgi:SagB-type dehydrogenase family enzyme
MWPLAMSHLVNSKLSPATAAWKTAPVAEFLANADAVIESTQARRTYPDARKIPLAAGRGAFGPSIWDVFRKRRTARAFAKREISPKALARLHVGAAGVTEEMPVPGTAGLVQRLRAWPSAGALYPIELYPVLLDGAACHFDPVASFLEVIDEGPMRARIAPHVLSIAGELDAPLLIVLTGMAERTLTKYGERGYRFLWLDAGHVAQNLVLAATALGLAACPIGGFHDDEIARELGIDRRESVLSLLAIGHPA